MDGERGNTVTSGEVYRLETIIFQFLLFSDLPFSGLSVGIDKPPLQVANGKKHLPLATKRGAQCGANVKKQCAKRHGKREERMNMNEITKVTIWNASVSLNKDTGKFEATGKNQWQIAVFTKEGNMTLAKFLVGMDGDKELKKYTGVFNHKKAVVLARQFADKYGLKAAEKTVVANYAACLPEYEKAEAEAALNKAAAKQRRAEKKAEEARKEREEAFAKAHPEMAATLAIESAVKYAKGVKSEHEGFNAYVTAVDKATNSLKATLLADIKGLEEAMKAVA